MNLSTLLALSIGGGTPPPRHHLSDAAQVCCSGAKSGSGRSPSYSYLLSQSGCRLQYWIGCRSGCCKEPVFPVHDDELYAADVVTGFEDLMNLVL